MSKTLKQAREEVGAKREQLKAYLAERLVEGEYKMPASDVEEVQRRNRELDDLGKELAGLEQVELIAKGVAAGEAKATDRSRTTTVDTTKAAQGFDLERHIAEHEGYKRFQRGEVKTVRFVFDAAETKTLLALTDIAPAADRRALVPSAQAYQPVSDLFMQGTTTANALEYYEETTFTNAAAERAEGVAAAESALDFTLRTDAIRSIATWLPATLEVLADNARLRQYIEGRLRFMVAKKRDAQLLIGDGTSPNLSGILDRSGIQTQAKSTDPAFDAIMKAMTKVRVTGDAEPSAIVLHPNDWQDILLTRTTDGIYIMGNPGDPTINTRLWGLQVRGVPALTEDTGIVGAFDTMAAFVRRTGLEIIVSTEHSTYFTERKMAILAEERVGIEVYRDAAFCSVTGL